MSRRPVRHRGDCSITILLLLAIVVGGWFYFQRRDFARKTSPELLEQFQKVQISLTSTKENRPFTSKKLMSWVRPGVELVLTSRFRLTSVLIREDFPTFERPAKTIFFNRSLRKPSTP